MTGECAVDYALQKGITKMGWISRPSFCNQIFINTLTLTQGKVFDYSIGLKKQLSESKTKLI